MMIGPAPMMRMLFMSVRLGTEVLSRAGSATAGLAACLFLGLAKLGLKPAQHQVIEALEERLQIVRARTRLRVALEAECRPVLEGEALERAVEERAVRGAHVGRQSRLIDGEAVILTGDEYSPGIQVLHRMVGAVMTELHLHGASAARQSQDLMAETDTEHGDVALEQLAGRTDSVLAGLRIARAIGEEDAVGRECDHLFGSRLSGHDGHAAAKVRQQAQDVAFDAEVISHDMQPLVRANGRARALGPDTALVPLEAALGADDLGEIHALQARELARRLDGGGSVHLLSGHDAAGLRAGLTQNARQPSRIDTRDGYDAAALQEFAQR